MGSRFGSSSCGMKEFRAGEEEEEVEEEETPEHDDADDEDENEDDGNDDDVLSLCFLGWVTSLG